MCGSRLHPDRGAACEPRPRYARAAAGGGRKARPAPLRPRDPVLPVVQDARPDPAPTPAPTPAPAPETPVLPAVQDAKLIQTGTSGWLADLMLGAGMVLSAAGYWMERKRKAMFYKSQH